MRSADFLNRIFIKGDTRHADQASEKSFYVENSHSFRRGQYHKLIRKAVKIYVRHTRFHFKQSYLLNVIRFMESPSNVELATLAVQVS